MGPAGRAPERVLKVGSGKKAVQEHQAKATLLAAFMYTPIFLIGDIEHRTAPRSPCDIGIAHGLCILYRGLPILLNTPADKTVIYVVAVLVVPIVMLAVISLTIRRLDMASLG